MEEERRHKKLTGKAHQVNHHTKGIQLNRQLMRKVKKAPQTEEGSAKTAEIEEGGGGLDQTIKQEVE